MLEIDCSHGEGGGQLARMAIAAAALTGKPVRLHHIRAGRSRPGLAAQHLAAVRAVADLCGAGAVDVAVGATELEFCPGGLRAGTYNWDVGTAGSITLVLQAALPPAVLSGGALHMRITGGTDVRAAPPLDYFLQVFLPLLARMGVNASTRVLRRGYYPRGGGVVEVDVAPGQVLHPLCLETAGALYDIAAYAHIANLPRHILERMCACVERTLSGQDIRMEARVLGHQEAIGQGGGLTLVARTEHSVLGAAVTAERGIRAETLGLETAQALTRDLNSGATLDVHAADQLLLYMALAGGTSRFRTRALSSHARSTLWLLERMFPMQHFETERAGLIEVELRSTFHAGG